MIKSDKMFCILQNFILFVFTAHCDSLFTHVLLLMYLSGPENLFISNFGEICEKNIRLSDGPTQDQSKEASGTVSTGMPYWLSLLKDICHNKHCYNVFIRSQKPQCLVQLCSFWKSLYHDYFKQGKLSQKAPQTTI